MVLHFLCPRGHHLTAPPERAGQAGACPRCQTRFLIPDRRASSGSNGDSASDEPLTAVHLPGAGEESQVEVAEESVARNSWPGIVAGLLASGAGSRSHVTVELVDGRKHVVLDMLLPRSTGDVAVLVVKEGEGRDVVAVPWDRVVCCRLEGWKAVNEVHPLGKRPND